MNGITVCICALIINSFIDLWKKAILDKITLIFFAISLLLYLFTNLSIVIIILGMGVFYFITEKLLLPKLITKGGEKH